jgi:hypothetical protein
MRPPSKNPEQHPCGPLGKMLVRTISERSKRVWSKQHKGTGLEIRGGQYWPRCRPECGWNSVWRVLRKHEGIVSGCKVNRLFNGLCGERLPTIELAHVDLS